MRKPQQDPLTIDELIRQAEIAFLKQNYAWLKHRVEVRRRRMYGPYGKGGRLEFG